MKRRGAQLRIGDLVEVRSEAEILATLDANGELDALPFMPEMLQFCGERFRVGKLAIKVCDTIHGTDHHRMRDAVHLEGVRCDGSGHGGCQARCLIFWKEAWLRPVGADGREPARGDPSRGRSPLCPRVRLVEAARRGPLEDESFACQATELMRAAPDQLRWWDVRQYVRDVRSGNARALPLIRSLILMLFNKYQGFSRRYLPRFVWIRSARRFPFIEGSLEKTPQELLNLQPGELVRIRSKDNIVRTLDRNNHNRGLMFDCEMLRYCGREARVQARVERIIDERTGKMLHLKNPCIMLEGVTCSAYYNRSCPRGIYSFWREIWLERVE